MEGGWNDVETGERQRAVDVAMSEAAFLDTTTSQVTCGQFSHQVITGILSVQGMLPGSFPDDAEIRYVCVKNVGSGTIEIDAIALESKCTPEELAERLGIPPPTDLPRDGHGGVATLASYTSGGDSEPIITASHASGDSCSVAVVSYLATIVGISVLVAAPPAGWLYWVAWGATGVGTYYSSYSVVDACHGVKKVMYRVSNGNKYNCTFHSNWNYGYGGHGYWVPFNERWNCP